MFGISVCLVLTIMNIQSQIMHMNNFAYPKLIICFAETIYLFIFFFFFSFSFLDSKDLKNTQKIYQNNNVLIPQKIIHMQSKTC